MFRRLLNRSLVAVALIGLTCAVALAEAPRILPEGQLPDDARLKPLKDLNGYFPFQPAASKADWERRAARVRRQILVANGLWPIPTKTPLNAVIHGRIERDDYTVEKAYFESFPGFYVTGNLYRPKGKSGKLPGVLCPHGHWSNGRFFDAGEAAAKKLIDEGAERFVESARSHLQARCVQLARMGCVVFHYDMIGYADSQQITRDLAHGFSTQREKMNDPENWGLFSPQAESHLQSVMGMQSYSSIRALDFLESVDDVDPKRLAVTGASGGGTQTFVLSAIDPRVAVSIPAVMVSTAMQGGCTCENCSLLRIGTGNVEFAALFAPKPLALTAADDWTREMETKGFPELQQHFRMLGVPDNVMLHARLEFGHNYNYHSRMAMSRWLNKHLGLGLSDEQLEERDFKRLTTAEMTVWDDEHPKPQGGDDFERKLLRWWTDDSQKQLAAIVPQDKESLRRYREVIGGAADIVIGRGLPDAGDLEYEQTLKTEIGNYLQMGGLLRNKAQAEELPIVFLYPKEWRGTVVVWLSADGKAGLYAKNGSPKPEITRLIDAGVSVVGVDLFYQGEFLSDGQPLTKTPRVGNPRESAGYTFGYNDAVFARRVHDVMTVVAFVRSHDRKPERVDVVGLGQVGPLAAAARAQAGDAISRAAVDTGGFRFAGVRDLHDPAFLPGGAKYFDVPGLLSLSAPDKLWLAGEEESGRDLIQTVYAAAGVKGNLAVSDAKPSDRASAVADWLLK